MIPSALRLEMLDRIHTGHQGISKCRERAKQSLWWSGLSQQLEELLGTDLFEFQGDSYLLVVDYYSRLIEIARLDRTTSEEIILQTKKDIRQIRNPGGADNGPQYSSEAYAAFTRQFQFEHVTSSPRYPQSNREAERAVQMVKNLLKKEADLHFALLSYRSTPLKCGFSPSKLLMARKLRTNVPITQESLKPAVPDLTALKEKSKPKIMVSATMTSTTKEESWSPHFVSIQRDSLLPLHSTLHLVQYKHTEYSPSNGP